MRTSKIKELLDDLSSKNYNNNYSVEHDNKKIRNSRWDNNEECNIVQNSSINQSVEFLKNDSKSSSVQKNVLNLLDNTSFVNTNTATEPKNQFPSFSFTLNSATEISSDLSVGQQSFLFKPPSEINLFEFIGQSTNPYGNFFIFYTNFLIIFLGPGPIPSTFSSLSQSSNYSNLIQSCNYSNSSKLLINSLDVILRARKELYERDLLNIKNIPEFLNYCNYINHFYYFFKYLFSIKSRI